MYYGYLSGLVPDESMLALAYGLEIIPICSSSTLTMVPNIFGAGLFYYLRDMAADGYGLPWTSVAGKNCTQNYAY